MQPQLNYNPLIEYTGQLHILYIYNIKPKNKDIERTSQEWIKNLWITAT